MPRTYDLSALGVPVEDVSSPSSDPLFGIHTQTLHEFATIYVHAVMLYGRDAISSHDGAHDDEDGYWIYIRPDRIRRL